MKRLIMLTILLVLGLALAACGSEDNSTSNEARVETGSSSNEVVSDSEMTETEANTAVSANTATNTTTAATNNPPPALEGDLSLQAQLALGTVKLEDTDLAVDEAQAADLLPLWQALQSLSQSDTTADVELQAVVNQIQDTMTPEQISAIADMQLTVASITEMMESGELAGTFGGRFGGSGNGNGGNGSRGDFAGGLPPGGGPGGGLPGGGPGFGGGNLSEDDLATRQAQFANNDGSTFQDRMLTGMVTNLLETKLGIVSERVQQANVMNDAFTAVADAVGLSVDELRNQMAEGQTLAQIVQGNNGDLDALQATLVQIFSDLPNADELDLEQSTADWLGVAQ